jgi:hypothetical protein
LEGFVLWVWLDEECGGLDFSVVDVLQEVEL